jgi:hypothetical protein
LCSIGVNFSGLAGEGAVAGFADHAGPLGQAQDIENQRHFAVAHHAGSGKRLDRLELLP